MSTNLASLLDCFCNHTDPKGKATYLGDEDDDTDSYYSDDSSYDDSDSDGESDDEHDEGADKERPFISDRAQVVLAGSNVFGANFGGRLEAFQQLMQRDLDTETAVAKQTNAAAVTIGHSAQEMRRTKEKSGNDDVKPTNVLRSILESQNNWRDVVSFRNLPGFFLEPTAEHIATYDMPIIAAVRSNDLEAIRNIHESGKQLQCCNRFGESVLHVAARCGNADVMSYLLDNAGLEVRVVCENGRTPLHDACWTTHPNFDVILILLKKCPDFLFVGDTRGFAPLDYVPREAWGPWVDFLEDNKDKLAPQTIDLYSSIFDASESTAGTITVESPKDR